MYNLMIYKYKELWYPLSSSGNRVEDAEHLIKRDLVRCGIKAKLDSMTGEEFYLIRFRSKEDLNLYKLIGHVNMIPKDYFTTWINPPEEDVYQYDKH